MLFQLYSFHVIFKYAVLLLSESMTRSLKKYLFLW